MYYTEIKCLSVSFLRIVGAILFEELKKTLRNNPNVDFFQLREEIDSIGGGRCIPSNTKVLHGISCEVEVEEESYASHSQNG